MLQHFKSKAAQMSESRISSKQARHRRRRQITKLLVANRSEIAIRVLQAANELGIRTVAIFSEADRLSLHRVKADESYQVGAGRTPLEAYLSIDEVIRVANETGADAVHPGYGFLSENPELAKACAAVGLSFVGPSAEVLKTFGNKVSARALASSVGVPVILATDPLPNDVTEIRRVAAAIGYPLMIKAAWGGGGRGIRPIQSEEALVEAFPVARSEAKAAFGRDDIYLERLILRAKHIEVQILGDRHGNIVHLYERDCSIQRRNQKIIERAPAPFLDESTRLRLCDAALRIARAACYVGAGTVEFLLDAETGKFYFIEVNPRIQVEHTVTEMVTGIDIVKAQIRIAEGGRIGKISETGIAPQRQVRLNGHALQCRITTENPQNGFMPDYGRISAYRGASGFGVRVDSGTAYAGAVVTPYYDSLLEKVTAWGATPEEAATRMHRALREYRVRGLSTNLAFLQSIIEHEAFATGDYTTKFIDETSGLFGSQQPKDRATKLLAYIADVTVNGKSGLPRTTLSKASPAIPAPSDGGGRGTKQLLERLGPEKFARWLRRQKAPLVTDTTMRDAHQALLATRMRSSDIVAPAAFYAERLPQLLSLECWGGATFDVAMRFLSEDPWERLAELRSRVPNIMLQMLLRGANAVGYANYPDNFVKFFVRQAAEAGIDLFRIFDCLNWVENMRTAIDAARETNRLVEGAVCYTGDILDPNRTKYSIGYYVDIARQLERAGCNILCVKDMAGLLKPAAARLLIKALRSEVGMPVHLHTHDTTGTAAATIIAAVESGVDAFDAAMDSMSGDGSQPCLGSLVQALRFGARDTGLDGDAIIQLSSYWAEVRALYAPFESNERWGSSEVYLHEMPGGQVTNLKEQARALGLAGRWSDVARAYRSANDLLGDIVKVTPTSKVVGDLALLMVAQDLTADDVLSEQREISFLESVLGMLRGELGQPTGGWPQALQHKVLKGQTATTIRPGAAMGIGDLARCRDKAERRCGRPINDLELASYIMYPDVFVCFAETVRRDGPVSRLPTHTFFFGMAPGEEIEVEIEKGKSLLIRLVAIGQTGDDGKIDVFFELNGQPRLVRTTNRACGDQRSGRRKAEIDDMDQVSAPFASSVAVVHVEPGQIVACGDILLTLEAMKMQTVLRARQAGAIKSVLIEPGDTVEAGDLLVELSSETFGS